jgi:hypothetical protein
MATNISKGQNNYPRRQTHAEQGMVLHGTGLCVSSGAAVPLHDIALIGSRAAGLMTRLADTRAERL